MNSPLVSCIIILTANDKFVSKRLIPSILENSNPDDIEIIVVHNGLHPNKDDFKDYIFLESDFGWVSKAINNGVNAAAGKYISIFHDDCLILDKEWINKCKELLEDNCVAVSPEIHSNPYFTVFKNVPLFMEKEKFIELGGYDENIFVGSEDIEFTLRVFSGGNKISKVDIDYKHYKGMSTVILYNTDDKTDYTAIFADDKIDGKEIEMKAAECIEELTQNEWANIIYMRDTVYIVNKYRDYLIHSFNFKLINLAEYFKKQLEKYKDSPLLDEIEGNDRFAFIYKKFFERKLSR